MMQQQQQIKKTVFGVVRSSCHDLRPSSVSSLCECKDKRLTESEREEEKYSNAEGVGERENVCVRDGE